MICPKCGKDAGEARVCPACGETLAAEPAPVSADTQKSGKKKSLIIGVVIGLITAVVIIICIVNSAKPAEYVSWPTLYSAFETDMTDGASRYGNKMLKFYVRVDEITEKGAYVTCYDDNWNEVTDVTITNALVSFVNVSDVQIGGKYVIEGKISSVLIGVGTGFDPIEITNAKIVETD